MTKHHGADLQDRALLLPLLVSEQEEKVYAAQEPTCKTSQDSLVKQAMNCTTAAYTAKLLSASQFTD